MMCWDGTECSFLLSVNADNRLTMHYAIGGWTLSYGQKTPMCCAEGQNGEKVCILGICIDSHGEIPDEEIPTYILGRKAVDQEYSCLDRFAGAFVVFLLRGKKIIVWPDASASIPIFYCVENDRYVASHERLISDVLDLPLSSYSMEIRKDSSFSEALPYNLTMYDTIKSLLPNHQITLTAESCESMRCMLRMPSTVQSIADRTLELTSNIARGYAAHARMIVALTGGWDSRLALALLLYAGIPDLTCYTTKKKDMSSNAGDLIIPQILCQRLNLPYEQIENLPSPKAEADNLERMLGEFYQNRSNFAHVMHEHFEGNITVIQGSSGDQLGKAIVGNSLPERFASASFLAAKTHMYHPAVQRETERWSEDAKTETQVSKFDLFEWEIRCGRWMSRIKYEMSTAGLSSLNIYNCRELLTLWCREPRVKRSTKDFYKAIFEKAGFDYRQEPINPDGRWTEFALNHKVTFWAGTMISAVRGKHAYRTKG